MQRLDEYYESSWFGSHFNLTQSSNYRSKMRMRGKCFAPSSTRYKYYKKSQSIACLGLELSSSKGLFKTREWPPFDPALTWLLTKNG